MIRNKVLIPLDGSEWSRMVLPQVRRFFEPKEYELILFRAAEEPQPELVEPMVSTLFAGVYQMNGPIDQATSAQRTRQSTHAWQLLEQMERNLENELELDAQALREEGYTVRVVVQFGDPAEQIERYVLHQDIDLVAMATHGRTGVRRVLLGSVAEHIVRQLPVPVLLVRPDA